MRFCTKPAMASVWPADISTPVSTSRTRSPGTLIELTSTLRVLSISLTRGRTSRRIRPLPSTMGTKSTWVPYFLYTMETVPRLSGTRMGNSPPTLKKAGRPLTATTVGSARIFIRLSSRNASNTPKNALLPSTTWKPNVVVLLPAAVGGVPGVTLASNPLTPEMTKLLPVTLLQSNPNARSLVRETSITRT